jgi:hypothetical protein
VARHKIAPRGTPYITLPQHAEAIRQITRGGSTGEEKAALVARGRHGKQPKFEQREHEEEAISALEILRRSAPEVEERSLTSFDVEPAADTPQPALLGVELLEVA